MFHEFEISLYLAIRTGLAKFDIFLFEESPDEFLFCGQLNKE